MKTFFLQICQHEKSIEIWVWQIGEHTWVGEADSEKWALTQRNSFKCKCFDLDVDGDGEDENGCVGELRPEKANLCCFHTYNCLIIDMNTSALEKGEGATYIWEAYLCWCLPFGGNDPCAVAATPLHTYSYIRTYIYHISIVLSSAIWYFLSYLSESFVLCCHTVNG